MNPEITKQRYANGRPKVRRFHQAKWDESIIFELSNPEQRGILVPETEFEIHEKVGDVAAALPEKIRRAEPPALPEISQPQVLRHYMRLSQENLGTD
ncbi:MAG TPA: hypothetical protein VMV80_05425, partial [Anaerolineales bacterium]|nr:hypothetical protein [Anaerolineales bacterium]